MGAQAADWAADEAGVSSLSAHLANALFRGGAPISKRKVLAKLQTDGVSELKVRFSSFRSSGRNLALQDDNVATSSSDLRARPITC